MIKPLETVFESLKCAYDAVKCRGDAAKNAVSTEIDLATEGDKIAGNAVIDYLKKIPSVGVVFTEEQGTVVLNKSGNYSVIMDDLDGTKNFKDGFGMLPCGSIIGVFEGTNPRFCDCIAAGYLDFPSGNLFFAERGKGAFIILKFASGECKKERITTSGRKTLFEKSNLTIFLDIYALGDIASCFAKYSSRAWLGDIRSTAAHISLVAGGAADLFIQGDNAFNLNKRKTGEEIGPGYLLITEAGGTILDWKGRGISEEKVGFGEKRVWHLVYAATEALAQEFISDMAKIPEVAEYMKRKNL